MRKKQQQTRRKSAAAPQILNRRARFDYSLEDELTAGLVLTGKEVRAARDGHVQLKGSFVSIRNHELWLNNASFSLKLNERGNVNAHTIDTSPKKLLVSRKELASLLEKKQQGYSIIPLKLLTGGRFIKLRIATGKGKKLHDKRETIKRRDSERDAKRAMAHY